MRLLERNRRNVALTEPGQTLPGAGTADPGQVPTWRAAKSWPPRLVTAASCAWRTRSRFRFTRHFRGHCCAMARSHRTCACSCARCTHSHSTRRCWTTRSMWVSSATRQLSAQDARRLRLVIIAQEPLLIALPAAHPLAGRPKLRLAELARDAFVSQPRELASTFYDQLVRLANNAGFEPAIAQHAQQLNGLLALVAAGMGIALVPASMQAVHLDGVRYVPLEDVEASMLLAAASRADDHSPALQHFLSTVAEIAEAAQLVG